jgi:hypothetical protein
VSHFKCNANNSLGASKLLATRPNAWARKHAEAVLGRLTLTSSAWPIGGSGMVPRRSRKSLSVRKRMISGGCDAIPLDREKFDPGSRWLKVVALERRHEPVTEPAARPSAIFPKNALAGLLSLALAWLQGGYPGPLLARKPLRDFVLSSFTLPHAATTLASKGLGAANRLIVACDTLKLRATSACASPLASLCMASRR